MKSDTEEQQQEPHSHLQMNDVEIALRFLEQRFQHEPNVAALLSHLRSITQQAPSSALSFESVLMQPQIKLYAGDITDDQRHGWIGLSPTQSDSNHITQDITQAIPLPDNSVDAFQAEDVLEHIEYERLPSTIDEIYRILKPGSTFRLSVPDYGCDLLYKRSEKDEFGILQFDPYGGGTREEPGHLWFPQIDSVVKLLQQTRFHHDGQVKYLHYYKMDGTPVMQHIDHNKGLVKRTPDFDDRVKSPPRPLSLVVDLVK